VTENGEHSDGAPHFFVSDAIYEMYQPFLDSGHSPQEFWDWTPQMITDAVEAYARRQRRNVERDDAIFKAAISALYMQALEIRDGTSAVLNPEGRLHEIGYYYPDIFPHTDEESGEDETLSQTEDDRILIAQKRAMDDFVFYHNRAFRAKHNTENPEVGNDTTGTQSTDISTD